MILVIDDEAFVARLAEAVLNRRGFEVVSAHTAHAALEFVKSRPDDVSLALVDYRLPDMDAVELLERLQEASPQIRMIISSGYCDSDILNQKPEISFLQKPYTADKLSAAVAAALS